MPYRQPGAVAVVALKGPTKTLYIIETTKPKPHYLKFLSETFEPGDTLRDAIVRALRQEAGMDDLVFTVGADGHVAEICDPRVLSVTEVAPPKELPSAEPGEVHTRYDMLVETTDEVVAAHGGKILQTPGERETIHTFALTPHGVRRDKLLPEQRELHYKLLSRKAAAA